MHWTQLDGYRQHARADAAAWQAQSAHASFLARLAYEDYLIAISVLGKTHPNAIHKRAYVVDMQKRADWLAGVAITRLYHFLKVSGNGCNGQ